MEIGKGKLTLEEILYFGFFIILAITKGFGFYEGQKIFTLLIIPAFLCALLKIFLSTYTRRQWIMQIVLLLSAVLVYYQSREIGIFFIMFMILGMKNISIRKVFHVGAWVWSVCAILLCIASFTRLEHTIYRVHEKMGMGHIFRWSLGFTHPNILHITYFVLCALFLYELAERYRFRHFLLLMLGNVLVFFYSVSFTGFGIVILLLVGGLYVKIRPDFCFLEKAVVNLVLPLCMIFSFVLPGILFNPRYAAWVQKLNFLLNTRLWLANQFLTPECMSLFGLKMSDLEQGSLAIDNSYIWGFINYGIIPFALLMLAYLAVVADYSRKQKTRELVIIVCFLGAGFTEQLLFNTSFKNVTLLFIGELLFRHQEGAGEYPLIPVLQQKIEALLQVCYQKLYPGIAGSKCFRKEWRLWIRTVWKTSGKQMAAGILTGMALGAVLCGILYTEPEGYVVPRFYTDGLYETSVYLESPKDPDYEGYRVMNYADADTPMQIVDGRAVTLETARYYTGSILIGGFTGYLVCLGTILLTDRRSWLSV